MKTPWFNLLIAFTLSASCFRPVTALAATPAGSAFTYQGRLADGGAPATGLYDLHFSLFDSNSTGTMIGSVLQSTALPVTNGLFTISLDFGPNAFNGDARWLQITVRTNGSTSPFTLLVPRQALMPAPYAIRAATVDASGVQGTLSDSSLSPNIARLNGSGQIFAGSLSLSNTANQFVGNGAGLASLNASNLSTGTVSDLRLSPNVALLNRLGQIFTGTNSFSPGVGIGTATPSADLDIANSSAAGPGLRLTGKGGAGARTRLDLATYDPGSNAPSARIQAVDDNWSGDLDILTKEPGANTNALVSRLRVSANGNVGIGTNAPSSKLTVRGDVRLGADASLLAPGASENLRIVRGLVYANGTIAGGTGFTVTHNSLGNYTITFTPAFQDGPAISVMPVTNAANIPTTPVLTSSSATIAFFTPIGAPTEPTGFSFTAIGPR